MPRRLVVGLGNPGAEYRRTRHNVGFEVLDRLASRLRLSFGRPRWGRAPAAEAAEDPGLELVLLKPKTYMNRSGEAVAKACEVYGVAPEAALVVCDDLNLPLGRLRLRSGGSAGGHHGLESILAHLGTEDFPRLRIGIGEVVGDEVPHVLGAFSRPEREEIESALDRAAEAARAWGAGTPIPSLMNDLNRRPGRRALPEGPAAAGSGGGE